ncbi:thiaminase II [Christensenellaceae bacterium OttesenSCG-928-M15]|nr:thiaminase II [Christensenellaceae bacterium OttesenSCG-928-M15]
MSFSRALKEKAHQVWEDGYHHPFVQGIGKGTLPKETFQFYLLQDYRYLLQYAKVFALAAVKAEDEETIARLTHVQHSILAEEMDMHRQYMAGFGIEKERIASVRPSLYNRTYTANMLAVGQTGELVDILATVFPCAWTYCDYAKRLKVQYADKLENNFYKTWIENYAGNAFEDSYAWFYDAIDERMEGKSERQKKKVEDIFVASVEFEYLFWEMSYKQEMSYTL